MRSDYSTKTKKQAADEGGYSEGSHRFSREATENLVMSMGSRLADIESRKSKIKSWLYLQLLKLCPNTTEPPENRCTLFKIAAIPTW